MGSSKVGRYYILISKSEVPVVKAPFPRSLSPFPPPSFLPSSSSPSMFLARRAVAFLGFALCFLLQSLSLWLCLVDFREHGWPAS